jgi:hypothetical protein
MKAVAPLGNMGHTDVFARRDQVLDPFRNQCPQRDLEGSDRHATSIRGDLSRHRRGGPRSGANRARRDSIASRDERVRLVPHA